MLRYKMDVLQELKTIGFSAYKLRKDKIMGEAQIQKIRTGEIASKETLNTLCKLLNCQPGDLIEYIPDEDNSVSGVDKTGKSDKNSQNHDS
ncbi:helix-turn-helix domain-containing protein [Coprococcus sp. B2-R-112]|uniref:helix-turn-helix domain-containing protein n=1 Tax=Coprococcus sp. B2-R-112 TaxID=2949662 RepID=UPI002030C84A|nr:helix-turn-helix transcriptional regulator [Coprococcus sp. B2-R-112]MCM0663593.1 helix-turn-helix transcriptional regulator [Coprococcus sp. B2-R-112]